MAGVEDDEVRLLHGLGFAVALGRQHVRHALGVIDVHLAAIGFDEDFFHEVGLFCLQSGGRRWSALLSLLCVQENSGRLAQGI